MLRMRTIRRTCSYTGGMAAPAEHGSLPPSLVEMATRQVRSEVLSGALSEQYDPETGESLSVVPLVWSHAELINTVLDLNKTK